MLYNKLWEIVPYHFESIAELCDLLVSAKRLTQIAWFYGVHHNLNLKQESFVMSNDDPKTEKPGLISRLWGWLFGDSNGDKTKGLKESKESDIDRSIRYNERNERVLCISIAGLLGFGATRDISGSSVNNILNFNISEANLNSYAQLIQTSWEAIMALASFGAALILSLLIVLMIFRGMYLKRKARLIEANSVTARVNKMMAQSQKKINNTEFIAKQANERADKAEDRLKEANKRAEVAESKIKAANDRADNALMIAANAQTASALIQQRLDEFKDEVVLTRKENHLLVVDLANAREELRVARADAAKVRVELAQVKSKLSQIKS